MKTTTQISLSIVAGCALLAAGAVGVAYYWPGQGGPETTVQGASASTVRQPPDDFLDHLKKLAPAPEDINQNKVCEMAIAAAMYGVDLYYQGKKVPGSLHLKDATDQREAVLHTEWVAEQKSVAIAYAIARRDAPTSTHTEVEMKASLDAGRTCQKAYSH